MKHTEIRLHAMINIKGSAQIFDAKHKAKIGLGNKWLNKITKAYIPPYKD